MIILDVLDNLVCRDHLLSILQVNDLLRLRRVSKTFKNGTEDFIRTKKVATKREIHLCLSKDDPFEEFDKFGNSLGELPIRKEAHIYFKHLTSLTSDSETSDNEEYQANHVVSSLRQDFLDIYGQGITRLELYGLQLPLCSERMIKFFDPFPNLTTLVFEEVSTTSEDDIPSTSIASVYEIKIPLALAKLKVLKIYGFSINTGPLKRCFDFIAKLVETCLPTLELLALPYNEFVEAEDMKEVMSLVCMCLFKSPIMKLDVNAGCLRELLNPDDRTPEMGTLDATTEKINDKIISINDPMGEILHLKLPNLEQISFWDLQNFDMSETDELVRRDWPKLKEIRIFWDDPAADPEDAADLYQNLLDLWSVLFSNGIRRRNMVKLCIEFESFEGHFLLEMEHNLARTVDLMTACSNLKILQLKVSLIKQLIDPQQLWQGLKLLEELDIEGCRGLEDSDFIGDDPENPVFWNLKKLKTLRLRLVDLQLTDELLGKVLVHMPLKELTLSSDSLQPDQHSFTLEGIKSLLTGQFANTIERLDFAHLNLGPSVSSSEKKQVESLFRSSGMI